jgi:hypothetical protein
MKRLLVVLAMLLVLAACSKQPPIGPLGSTHIHADFKVYIEGKPVDFAKRDYMVAAKHVHIEGMNGDVIHFHATGVTIGEFFRTLGMRFTSECFVLDKNHKHCTKDGKTLKFYANGEPNDLYNDYLPGDLDKLLISYGAETPEEIQRQLASITNYSRIESGSGKTMRLG